jgi:CheY-like chemotaxis protein
MKKILVVDDSPAWHGFHKKFLEEVFIELETAEEDYKLDFAVSGKDGYNYIMQNNDSPYDLIISDLQMEEDYSPKYAGEWFVEQVKTFSNYFNTKIVICSGCYNIKHIAQELSVFYIPKRVAVNDVNEYKDLVISLIKDNKSIGA